MASSIKALIPAWTYDGAEDAVCSGACLAVPCLDPYAPNVSGCCCMPLRYSEQRCTFDYFFTEVLPRLHTGDVFLTSWPAKKGEWAQTARCMMRSRWTHVGMVYRPSDCPKILHTRDRLFGPQVNDTRPLIAQMLVYGQMGFRDGQGFEMVDLETWVKDYLDKYSHDAEPDAIGQFFVGVRFLTDFERDEQFYKAVQQKVDDYWHRPYEQQDTMMAAIDLCECIPYLDFTYKKDDDSSVFCSELVAEIYKAAGLLNPNLSGNEFIPRNFDTTSMLLLKKGAKLSCEYVIASPTSEEERLTWGYKNRGKADPLSKNRFGHGGFWGVDTYRPVDTTLWGAPEPPPPPPAPAEAALPCPAAPGPAVVPPTPAAEAAPGVGALTEPPEQDTMDEPPLSSGPAGTASIPQGEPAILPAQIAMSDLSEPAQATGADLTTPLLHKA